MMAGSRTLTALTILLISSVCDGQTVASVEVSGSNLQVKLATQVGQPFDDRLIAHDVRYLWGLGRFEDIRVETEAREDGIAVFFRTRTTPIRMLREIRIEPNTFGLEIRIPPNTPMTDLRAHNTAIEAERQLHQIGYQGAHVRYQLKSAPLSQVDLRLTVDLGDAIRVKQVTVEGGKGDLHALRSHRILFWRLLPSYSAEAVDSDVARIRSSYLAKGYLDANVRPGATDIRGNNAAVTILVNPGQRHLMDPCLCRALFVERRDAQRQGILDFAARIGEDDRLTVERGQPYRVGRIEFSGNHRYRDTLLRRNFLIAEGELMNERRLRQSIANLNRTSMFENIRAKNVIVQPNEKTGVADVTVHLTERKPGSWRLSGPVGPAALAGPLEASLSARLPPWGRGILELSTYTASLSLLAFYHPIVPIVNAPKAFTPIAALARPYVPGEGWRSGFTIAPQLGWTNDAIGYGVTQTRERLLPLVSPDRSLEPDLAVTVSRASGDAVMTCEPPKPRLRWVRLTASLTIRVLGSFAAL